MGSEVQRFKVWRNLGNSPQLECWPALGQFVVDMTYDIVPQI